MSIIHDALKKVQKATLKQTPQREAAPFKDNSPDVTPTLKLNNISHNVQPLSPLTIIVMSVTGTIVFILMIVLIRLALNTAEPAQPLTQKDAPVSEPLKTLPLVKATNPTSTQNRKEPENLFKIEGIMDTGSKKVVLINGGIYEEGQTLNGAIITAITSNSVILEKNGTKITLPTALE